MQHHHDRACRARRLRSASRSSTSTWWARSRSGRLVEQQQVGAPAPAPSRSRPAAAGRRTARRPAGRPAPACRSPRAPRRPPSSSARPLPEPALVRVAAAADQVGDGDALRARSAICGSSPSCGPPPGSASRWMASPSSSTAPAAGLSSRARPRSRVDLPQRVGADDHGDLRRRGWPASRSSTTAGRRRPGASSSPRSCGVRRSTASAARPTRLARTSSQSRYGAPTRR